MLCTFKFRNLIYSTKTWPSKSQRLEGAVILKIEKREQAAALGAKQKAFQLFAPFMTFKCWCSTIFAFFQAQKSCNAKNCCNRKICSLCTTNWLTTLIVGFFLHHQFHSVLCLRRPKQQQKRAQARILFSFSNYNTKTPLFGLTHSQKTGGVFSYHIIPNWLNSECDCC